jgi:predicted aspartyl protease
MGAIGVGRIVASVSIQSYSAPDRRIRCDALVDTGASHMTLPSAWRERLGELQEASTVEVQVADQKTVRGLVCGPLRLQIEGFRPVSTEVVFVEMEPEDGEYEPLIGYIPLEQSQAAVDILGHRLVRVKHLDLK